MYGMYGICNLRYQAFMALCHILFSFCDFVTHIGSDVRYMGVHEEINFPLFTFCMPAIIF